MTVSIYSISALIILLLTSVVSSNTVCDWKPTNLDKDPNAQLSFLCTDPTTPIIIIENAIIGFAQNPANNKSYCQSNIGCSQHVPDITQYCTGHITPCELNQANIYTPYASQNCGYNASSSVPFYLNHVVVNYSCISANVEPPHDICISQLSLFPTGHVYLSTSISFPLALLFPSSPFQCSCLFTPAYPAVKANISIRAMIVDLEDYTSCSQKLTIRSCSNNDTVFCSRYVSSNVTTYYVQLELNPSISFQTFQSKATNGHFLLEIRALTSSISGQIGTIACSRTVVPSCGTSSTLASIGTTSGQSYQTTIPLTKTSANQQRTLFTSQSETLSSNVSDGNYSSIQTTAPGHQSTSTPTNLTRIHVVAQALQGPSLSGPTVPGGAIAGIVVGCFVFVILLIVILVVLLRYRSKSGSKPRHKSLSKEKLSNDQSNGTGLTSSNGVAALRRHETTEFMAGSASNLKPERADNISGVYDIPASAYNLDSIKNEKLAKQKARMQAYEMKPLPDSNSDHSRQNQMIGCSTLTLMPTHEVGGRSGNINVGSGLTTSQIDREDGGKVTRGDGSNNGQEGRDKAGVNQDTTSTADAKLKPRSDSELMLVDNNLYMVGAVANQSTPAGDAKLKPLFDSELMLVDNNLYLDGTETRAIMEHF